MKAHFYLNRKIRACGLLLAGAGLGVTAVLLLQMAPDAVLSRAEAAASAMEGVGRDCS